MVKILLTGFAVWALTGAAAPASEARLAGPGVQAGLHEAAAKRVKKPRAKKPRRVRRAPVQQEYLIPPDDSELLPPPRLDLAPYSPRKRLPFPRACSSNLDCAPGTSCDALANQCR